MATRYEVYSRRRHGAKGKRNVHTAYTYAIPSHINIAVSVYNCEPCWATCMDVDIRLQRRVSAKVFETVGARLNKKVCDSRVGPGRVDETFKNVLRRVNLCVSYGN